MDKTREDKITKIKEFANLIILFIVCIDIRDRYNRYNILYYIIGIILCQFGTKEQVRDG